MRYTLDGTKILRETWDGNTLVPLYDNEDGICGILYNNAPYYFIENLQGDVIAIVDKDAKTVARYSYDAWGVCSIVSDSTGFIATVNPFRYRSYYFDQEIGLYYLNSRYYNAHIGIFINSDMPILPYLLTAYDASFNVYSYCNCDPIKGYDPYGYIYLSNSTLKSYISNVSIGMKFSGGWAIVGSALAFYIPELMAWVNSLPIIGQVMFCIILASAAKIALEFAYAVYVKNCGLEITLKKWNLKISYK